MFYVEGGNLVCLVDSLDNKLGMMVMILLQYFNAILIMLNLNHQGISSRQQDYSGMNPDRSISMMSADTSVFGTLPSELDRYYHYINLAARAIYRNEFDQAAVYYDTAFMHKTHPFYVDLANFVRVNYKCGRWEKNDSAIYRLMVEKHIDTISLYLHIPKMWFSANNQKLIRKLCNRSKPLQKASLQVEETLRKFWEADQGVREYDKIPMMSREEIQAMYQRRDSIDSIQVLSFIGMVHTFGFPDEEMLGVDYHDSLSWNSVLRVLLLHFLQAQDPAGRLELIGIILDAVHSGAWSSSLAASLLDYVNIRTGESLGMGQNFMYTSVYLVMGELYRPFVFYTDSLMQMTNLNRMAVGLDSFHIAQKQAVCQYLASEKQPDKRDMVIMLPWAAYDELPPGLVRQSAKDANVDMASYKINTSKILEACRCEEKKW